MPFTTESGISIFFETAGEGHPFVFVHANPCDHNMWLYQTARFSEYFRTVAMDLRGYGRSAKPEVACSFAAVADDILGVCRAEGITRAILAGASIGSKLAFHLALERPEMFDALVLVGGNAKRGGSYDSRIVGYRERGVADYRREHLESLVAPGFAGTAHGRYLLDALLDRTPALSGEAIARLFEAFDGVDLFSRVAEIELPVLIVNGEHDMSLPGARETADRLPDAVHRIIPDAGHLCCLEAPAAFDAIVVEFLRSRGLMPESVS
jgi:3-oxoadipate enol-lactonase